MFGIEPKKAYARAGMARLGGRLAIHLWNDSPATADYTKGYFGTVKLLQFDYNKDPGDANYVEFYGKIAHAHGFMCFTNCLNELDDEVVSWHNAGSNPSTPCETLDTFIAFGADFIQTDNLEIVDQYMKNKGLR